MEVLFRITLDDTSEVSSYEKTADGTFIFLVEKAILAFAISLVSHLWRRKPVN